jgi:hypothetical protein
MYTTHVYKHINWPLRDNERRRAGHQCPLPVTTKLASGTSCPDVSIHVTYTSDGLCVCDSVCVHHCNVMVVGCTADGIKKLRGLKALGKDRDINEKRDYWRGPDVHVLVSC